MRIRRSRDWAERDDIVDRSPAVSRLIRRQRIFIGCAVAAAVLALAGLASSLLIKSPAQRAADAGPPNASQLTATVQKVVLKDSVVVRGTVVSSGVVSVTTNGSAAAAAQILTELPKAVGSSIASGDVIAAVSGRPIIVLPGAIPAYRDLKPGDVGPDVAQLQRALVQLGYPNSDPAATFGSATKQAVTKFYGARGYDPVTTGLAIDASGTTPIQQAQKAVSAAQRTVAVDQDTGSIAVGPAAASAKQQLAADQQDLITAKSALANLQALAGPEVPLAEIVFVATLPATLSGVNAAVGANVATLTAPLMTIDTSQLAVQATVPAGQQQLIKVGDDVEIDDDINQRSATGKVASLGSFSAGASAGGQDSGQSGSAPTLGSAAAPSQSSPGYPVSVSTTSALAATWRGADVRLTITTGATPLPVLVVPVAAVYSNPDGTTAVLVAASGRSPQRRVVVRIGATANGLVQVTPIDDELQTGDLVVTGR